jgi:hypothetical protein
LCPDLRRCSIKTILGSRRRRWTAIIGIFLIGGALAAGILIHASGEYTLNLSSTQGGTVTTPGEGTFGYGAGTIVNLVAISDAGYRFVEWTGDEASIIGDVNAATTTVTIQSSYNITANFAPFAGGGGTAESPYQIADWHHLDMVRNYLNGHFILMNDLNSTTAGYEDLASRAAHRGWGWEPIGIAHPYVPFTPFAGSFDGNGYQIRNLFINRPGQIQVGLFGIVADGGVIKNVGVVNANMTGEGLVSLVGMNAGTVRNSYLTGYVTGEYYVGGVVGGNAGIVSNSYYNYNEVLINGQNMITIGALFGEDFEQWLASDKFLDVNERLWQENGYYVINNISDFKQLLAFGQDNSLKFRLKNDLDLLNEPNFYIPYLAGEFDGDGHKISNLSLTLNFSSQVGLFGILGSGAKVSEVGVESVNIIGAQAIGGLVGVSSGTVSNSYSSGEVAGSWNAGGLVGVNADTGTVRNSYSIVNVTGESNAGGLVADNCGTVSNSYSTGSVTGNESVGGLVGHSCGGSTFNESFWDTDASGLEWSLGGTGKTTEEMMCIATYTDTDTEDLNEPWNIIGVDPGETNDAYIWNIVDGETYPFLSWEYVF